METQATAVCSFKLNTVTAKISGEIDHHTVRSVRGEIDEALYTALPKKLILDLSNVCFMDSSGLGLIVGRVGGAKEIGATVEIVGASARICRIFEMAGLNRIEGLTIKGNSKEINEEG